MDQRLLAYALAGAGAVTLTPAASAEIVYTPADVILTRGLLQIDLDHDGTLDFHILNYEHQSISSAYVTGFLAVDGHGNASAAIVGQALYRQAYALPRGFPIGQGSPKPFLRADTQDLLMANVWCYPLAGVPDSKTPQDCNSGGFWRKATQRFLGLRFQINGETHYGWIRFSTTSRFSPLPLIKARLTGYAYETEPNKTILAGDTGMGSGASLESNPALEPASLGRLSLGSVGLDSWRQQKEISHADDSGH